MLPLQMSAHITPGDMLVRIELLKSCPLFLKEKPKTIDQCPKAHYRLCLHNLIMVTTQKVFDVLKEDFNVPTDGQDIDDRLRIGIKQGASPIASLAQRSIQTLTSNKKQGWTQLPYPGAHCVHVNLPPSLLRGPDSFLPIFRLQGGSIFRKAHPDSLTIGQYDSHLAVAFQAPAYIPIPLPGRTANTFVVIPGIHHNVGVGLGNRLKGLNSFHRQVYLAFERDFLPFTDRFLAVEFGQKGTSSAQQYVKGLEEAMACHHLFLGSGVMTPYPFHLAPPGFGVNRIVQDQKTCHYGFSGPSRLFGPVEALTDMLRHYQGHHSSAEKGIPGGNQSLFFPGPAAEEAGKARKAYFFCYHPQKPCEGATLLTFYQPQQYGNEVETQRRCVPTSTGAW